MESQYMNSGLSVIVPVYNEVDAVESTVRTLQNIIKDVGVYAELIVVDDGSNDGTSHVLNGLHGELQILRHPSNRGYGAAIKTGISHANYQYVAITDADGTYPNEDLPRLLGKMETHDMVVGARTSDEVHIPLIRRPAKWVLNKIANYLSETKIPDLNSGFRIFRKDIAEQYFHILPNRFSFTTTITLAMISDGYRVHYEPINYHQRAGKSKIKPGDAWAFLMLIIRTITYFNPLRFFLPFAVFLFLVGIGRLGYDVFWLHNLTDSTTLLFLFALQVSLIGIVADLIVKRSGPLKRVPSDDQSGNSFH